MQNPTKDFFSLEASYKALTIQTALVNIVPVSVSFISKKKTFGYVLLGENRERGTHNYPKSLC